MTMYFRDTNECSGISATVVTSVPVTEVMTIVKVITVMTVATVVRIMRVLTVGRVLTVMKTLTIVTLFYQLLMYRYLLLLDSIRQCEGVAKLLQVNAIEHNCVLDKHLKHKHGKYYFSHSD